MVGLNKEQISYVRVVKKPKLCTNYKRKGNKIVWTDSLWDFDPWSVDRFRDLEEYRVINNAIVECPHIYIKMNCGNHWTLHFKTLRELDQWHQNNLSDINFIEVI